MSVTTSKLLINESPLTVLPSLVALVGLEKAIILQQVHYACQQPKSGAILADGQKYVWNTYRDWQANYFPFWKPENIKKHFLLLEKLGFLVSCQAKIESGDATKFYRVNQLLLDAKMQETGIVNSSRPSPQPELTMGATPVDDGDNSSRPSIIGTKTSSKTSYKEEKHIPQASAIQAASEAFEMDLPINSQDAIETAAITNLELWRTVLTEAKAGMSAGQWSNANYKQRAIGFALSSYRTAFERKTNNFKPPQPQITNHGGYDSTKDMLSPDYVAPRRKMTFAEVIEFSYDLGTAEPTVANFERTKADYLKLAGMSQTAQTEVETYERSDEFRKIFSQTESAIVGSGASSSGRGQYEPAANQMPVSR